MISIDTNVMLALLRGRLRPDEDRVVGQNGWAISDAVLWELGVLERDRQIQPVLITAEFSRLISRMTVFPVDVRIALALRQLDFRSDPADEIIAATSMVHDMPLLTRDTRMLESRVVPLALR